MNISQLIKRLEKLDPNLKVVISIDEHGTTPLRSIRRSQIFTSPEINSLKDVVVLDI